MKNSILSHKEELLCVLQMMEHLRNTKASVMELQGVKDLLNSKADLTDVNAALSQVYYISFLHAEGTTKLSLMSMLPCFWLDNISWWCTLSGRYQGSNKAAMHEGPQGEHIDLSTVFAGSQCSIPALLMSGG